jgi:hypothetical protein
MRSPFRVSTKLSIGELSRQRALRLIDCNIRQSANGRRFKRTNLSVEKPAGRVKRRLAVATGRRQRVDGSRRIGLEAAGPSA